MSKQTVKNEVVIACDIDDTLVMHNIVKYAHLCAHVLIPDPVKPGTFIKAVPNWPMIRLVEEELARGSFIIFWSRGGFQWAENVVKALGIESKNLVFMTKPRAYFDDRDVDNWLTDKVYLEPDMLYKNK